MLKPDNSYNANGWLKSTAPIVKGPNGNDTRLDYQYTIDASGNIASYALVAIGAVAYNDLFQYQYLKTTSYQQLSVSANRWTNSASPLPGGIRTTYDANGNATGLIDSRDITKTSTYVSDYAGHIYSKQSIGKTVRYFYLNGEQVGSNAGRGASDFGYAESAMAAPSDAYFTAVSERYPVTSPTTYTVQTGDILKTYNSPISWLAYCSAKLCGASELRASALALIELLCSANLARLLGISRKGWPKGREGCLRDIRTV